MWAQWCLANMIEFMLPSAHPSPQPKWQIDWFRDFCTVHDRKSLYITMGDPVCKIAPSHGRSGPIYFVILWAFPRSQLKRHNDRFSRFHTGDHRVSLYFTMGRPFPPSKLPLPMGGSGPHVIHGSPDPPKSSTQTAAPSVQPFLQGSLV